jgi:hypothetical protein
VSRLRASYVREAAVFFACFGFEEISIQSFDVKKKYETPDASFELCV